MKIEILGMGCQKCNALDNAAKQAAKELGIDAEFAKVEDIKEIMKYGVMTTPALVVDGVVKVAGKVPGKDEIKAMLK
ncbi:small redox-active disulfide protein 2 [Sporomusaceae bacterium BoRhaA]|uniref:thioredoxin family protein n=1 Tax=Pelorhabdus rhamnosifermentans TaxID=2772457 RepID=UPI001C0644ED|nr:thioredoxin family protein [Pelorhabdus rhamnosifermentans]MBU2701325.1 small redox-active disulfide protein 2 [Pelorhabdus rhamnosifermentans]